MKKNKIFSVISSLIVVMMLTPQIPVRATEINTSAQNGNIVIEQNKSDNEDAKEESKENTQEVIINENKVEEDAEKNKVDEINTLDSEENEVDETNIVNSKEDDLHDKSDLEEGLVGERYEYKNRVSVYSSFEPQVYEREEFNLKQESFNEIEELQLKTDANYEIALAYEDGSYVFLDSSENIEEAMEKIEETSFDGQSANDLARTISTENANGPIPVILNSDGRVVYSTKSMGRILKHIDGEVYGYFDINTNLYSDSSLTNAFNYINQGYVDDVPVIEDNGSSAKILVNGYEGWINRDVNSYEYDMIMVPINQVTNPSYYVSENGVLKHFISSNLRSSSKVGTTIEVGVAPSYLKNGVRYLSYDGNYFYDGSDIANGLNNLLTDLQSNSHSRAVNSSNVFYNYYNYLPFRSTSNHSADDLNRFIASNTTEQDNSKLRGTGSSFIDAQNKYGVNALIALGVAINESNWGRSSIAQQKNNIFGINAVDSNPGEAADTYATVADSIYEFAKNQISRAYADPANWAYYGGYLGNKKLGANVKYASDPFWGEKASQYAFKADYYISGNNISRLKDYNNFQLAIFTSPTQVKNSSGQLLYNVRDNFTEYAAYVGTPVVVNSTSGSNYVINPERTTPLYSGGPSNKYHGNYNFNDKGYVNSSSMKLINTVSDSNTPNYNKWVWKDGNYYYYDSNGKIYKGWLDLDGKRYYLDKTTGIMRTGWLQEGSKWYYFNSNGEMCRGWVDIAGYRYNFNNDGTMVTGWRNFGGSWYFFWDGGSMATGWVESGGHWYYTNSDGVMLTGWQTIKGYKYYFWGGGSMATGWVESGDNWYYFWDGGSMATGWINAGGYWYYTNSNGEMLTGWQTIGNKKYYFWGGGSMATGSVNLDGQTYYFNPDGSLI